MIYLLGYPRALSYDLDWIQAFMDHYGDICRVHLGKPQFTGLHDAELVVLMHSCTAQGVNVPNWVFHVKHHCPWMMLSGNDYKHFDDKRNLARELSLDLIITTAPNTPLHSGNGIGRVTHLPPALNPKAFRNELEYRERPIRVGFRGFRYPPLLGDDERNRVVEGFMSERDNDVAFEVFDHPMEYASWLGHCKATPATECGAPGMKAVSSRHFDSIGSGAALIMTPGDYSGCLTEGEHYLRLEPDLSNKAEVLEVIDDEDAWSELTQRALAHVMQHHTYANRMQQLDEMLWQ